ncbi:hypothetical protein RJ639_015254 [Escallonia herrerae]|uniref:WW domain-containing protein n=1 Tax=Escallonia herrerae TaxID=1293975 RepID=A0AA88VNH8_9ASTE|nr:hypothetical protein RJ639_015254 [Escallonia herrerae]
MSSAGRRVKLDLFAEPSGDLGGSSDKGEVGGDDDSNSRAGLPNSPSPSGGCEERQRPENPLLLLGQYSDEEVDEELSKDHDQVIVENFLADFDDEAKVAATEGCEDVGGTADRDLSAQKVEHHNIENASASVDVEERVVGENGELHSDDLHREVESTEQVSVAATSDIQVDGDAGSCWKVVLHEESNQYYYWNTMTGETSWDVPGSYVERKAEVGSEGRDNPVMGTNISSLTSDMGLDGDMAVQPIDKSREATDSSCEIKEFYMHQPEMELVNERYNSSVAYDYKGGHAVSGDTVENSFVPNIALYRGTTVPGNLSSTSQDASLGNGSAAGVDLEKDMDYVNLSSHLLRHTESLLDRLKSLEGSKGHLLGNERITKYILEVEIRLCDIKSLFSYGSSLLPFWLHSQRQLKQLEASVNEVCHEFASADVCDIEATNKPQERIDDITADAKETSAICPPDNGNVAELPQETHNTVSFNTEHVLPVESSGPLSDSGGGGPGEVRGVATTAELASKSVVLSGEDVDMDVEMEVEDAYAASDATTGDTTGAQYCAPVEQLVYSTPPAKHELPEAEVVVGVPPPPDEDWIPPPPPDDEPFPPPPPDEPPESHVPPPPSDVEAVQPFSYAEPFNITYPGSQFQYYGQGNTEVPSNSFYVPADACQIAVSLPQLYYEVPNTYPSVAPVVVNPLEPVAYYGYLDGTVPHVPGVSVVETSGVLVPSHGNVGSDHLGLGEACSETGHSSASNAKAGVSSVGGETEIVSAEVSSNPLSVEALSTRSTMQSISVSSTPIAAAVATATTITTTSAPSAAVPKVQSKVSQKKKRTVAVVSTLKSNKKVSSLVDKWKAAKEELHEDEEDEPEDACEILEKKRRREIEKWRAQQIASGEAKDNANFQPLGGDWRERVKRRRAKLTSEAAQNPSEGLSDGNQQPDLDELSRDLPSGWQAFWDDSSKQVYYGNSATSETTWIRPTS